MGWEGVNATDEDKSEDLPA